MRKLVDEVDAERAADRQLVILIDNTFAAPFGQRPLALGADIVLHSLTKNLEGFGTELGGNVICPRWLLPQRELALVQLRDFDGDFAASAYSVTLAVSLGHTKTRIEMPVSMTHSSYTDEHAPTAEHRSAIRLSIGLERHGDIIHDLEDALAAVTRSSLTAR